MPRPSKYQPEFRERSVRIARESERPIAAVGRDLGIHPETLRVWVRQEEADDGTRADCLLVSPATVNREVADWPFELDAVAIRQPQPHVQSEFVLQAELVIDL